MDTVVSSDSVASAFSESSDSSSSSASSCSAGVRNGEFTSLKRVVSLVVTACSSGIDYFLISPSNDSEFSESDGSTSDACSTEECKIGTETSLRLRVSARVSCGDLLVEPLGKDNFLNSSIDRCSRSRNWKKITRKIGQVMTRKKMQVLRKNDMLEDSDNDMIAVTITLLVLHLNWSYIFQIAKIIGFAVVRCHDNLNSNWW